mmetsp:Transcript_2406/g.3396  ORF Transcript_2406/g.3396 Transcript_2406/m.3396 type:complete len:284 (-) Transcript_2406:227-1078(-)|eukprot:CAMPEP_0117752934 /NCGR_PEP_ID=MMETSP0947-20121206/11920_1 /TAXON_ID=44440 /ORGANISM="Chattonella subsalsa, Strain CCMP2191" /LENGTH=283 /DNA_ID=CAMNT_0005571709 /DNA_START=177 /DNA_END=1028 /DNA_ORIENTATION=+
MTIVNNSEECKSNETLQSRKNGSTLVIFDHDNSLTNMDSGLHTIGALSSNLNDNFKTYMDSGIGWTRTMDTQLGHLFDQGVTREQIEEASANCPVQPGMVDAIRLGAETGGDFWIISDGNEVFIREFLKLHGLTNTFSKIHTNRAEFTEEGQLHVSPYHSNEDCSLCPSNLCKGRVLRGLLEELETPYSKIVYIGDGRGDYCPSTVLRPEDVLLVRNGGERQFELIKVIQQSRDEQAAMVKGELTNPQLPVIQAEIVEWDSGEDILRIFTDIFDNQSKDSESI